MIADNSAAAAVVVIAAASAAIVTAAAAAAAAPAEENDEDNDYPQNAIVVAAVAEHIYIPFPVPELCLCRRHGARHLVAGTVTVIIFCSPLFRAAYSASFFIASSTLPPRCSYRYLAIS